MNLNPDALFCSLSDSSCTFELQTVHQTFPLLIIHSFLSYSLCSAALTLIFPLSFQKKGAENKVQSFKKKILCTKSFQGNSSIVRLFQCLKLFGFWSRGQSHIVKNKSKYKFANRLQYICTACYVCLWVLCKFPLHKSELRVQTTQAELN